MGPVAALVGLGLLFAFTDDDEPPPQLMQPEEPHSWLDHGILFTYDPASGELSATHGQTLTGEPGTVEEHVGVYPDQATAHIAAMTWMPFGGAPVPQPEPAPAGAPSWVDHGIVFTWMPSTGELVAVHSMTVTGEVGPMTSEAVGTFGNMPEAYAASLGWMPFAMPPPETATITEKPQTVQVDLGPDAPELNEYLKPGTNDGYWVVTTSRPVMLPGGPSVESTWRVWGPNRPVAGEPNNEGATGSRTQSWLAATTWVDSLATAQAVS